MLYRVHLAWTGFELTTLLVIGIGCIGSCKPNYHTITTALVRKRNHSNYLQGAWMTYTLKTFSVIGIYEVDGDERLDVLVVMVYLFSSIYVVRLLVVHHMFCHKIWRSCCIYLLWTDFSVRVLLVLWRVIDSFLIHGQHILQPRYV
jgi:hypothetical protein